MSMTKEKKIISKSQNWVEMKNNIFPRTIQDRRFTCSSIFEKKLIIVIKKVKPQKPNILKNHTNSSIKNN